MRTRAKAAASHCIVTRVPVEILTSILKYGCIGHKDLRSIAGTCRYLRAVASPLLFHEMIFVVEKLASLDVLQALKTNATKAQIVEHLTIRAKSHMTPLQAGRYLPIVSSVLPHLTNLTALSIPFALLSEAVFTFVYDHPTIVSLGLNNVSKGNAAHAMSLNSTVVRPPRSNPLSVPAVFLDNTGGHAFSELFLKFLDRHKIAFPHVEFIANDPMPTFLTQGPLPGLDRLSMLVGLTNLQKAYDFVPLVTNAQRSIGWIDSDFLPRFFGATFELGDAWSVWQPDRGPMPIKSTYDGDWFIKAWNGIDVLQLKLSSVRLRTEFGIEDDELDPEERGVLCLNVIFARGAVLTPTAIRVLTRELYWISVMTIGGCVGWEDWSTIVRILDGADMPGVYGIDFDCSLTPTPTVSTTLACSSACYAKLATKQPSLIIDADLVGGYLAVWDIAYRLNLARVKQIAGVVRDCRGQIRWTVLGTRQVVEVKGAFNHDDDGDMVWARDAYAHVATADRAKECFCFGCGEVMGDDPVTALRKCPVDEVRDALKTIGFDLDAFDLRTPAQPNDATSFETVLRSPPVGA